MTAHLSHRAQLVSSREIAPNIRHFEFAIADVEKFGFVPGQFLSFVSEVDGKAITRAYSIASVPDGNRVAICLNLVDDGHLSPRLFAMRPGDEMEVKGPYGGFIFREKRDTVCVATGTGIAPFRGMLLQRVAEDPEHEYTLVFGVRHGHGLLYREEWERMAAEHLNFRFVPTLTRPPEHWTGRIGRVQPLLLEAVGERRDVAVYVCGLKEMVDDVRGKLKDLGFDRKQIVFEKYD
jgi:CDP-4-dehydro-6-deoxyglucose reductase